MTSATRTRGQSTRQSSLQDELDKLKHEQVDLHAQIDAINRSQAVIAFDLDGTILSANENFLSTMGYSEEEIVGKHHSMFAEPGYAQSSDYKAFWRRLRAGEFDAGEYKRLGKGGREIWIQATYNPIFDDSGKAFKVVKYATDITARKLEDADYRGQLAAISKSQAVIEFDIKGNILAANDNFLSATGYQRDEVVGKHHRMFVAPAHAASPEYQQFWQNLQAGKFDAGEYARYRKDGSEVWIQASYNPIFDMNGKVFKVVKYATDITEQKLATANFEGQIAAISKNQAIIEFDLDGNILTANDNFLNTMGYRLNEIQGQHHRIFVDPAEVASPAYTAFWRNLRDGKFDTGEYRRHGKNGKDVWIQASYNPILDINGKPYKVVKYVRDTTDINRALEEIQQLITAASAGDLSRRIKSTDAGGFVERLGNGINQLLDAIVGPVTETVRVAKALAEGDLTQQMEGEYSGEFAVLRDAVNETVANLEKMVADILLSAGQISTSAKEISEGNINLSQRTEEQASSLEETAASMEELTSTVKQSADNARQAADMADEARGLASEGGEIVGRAVAAMEQINQASSKIADIIGVIDEIAFQTNLLALNAAVEAARAGEHGRGFAVVASEVRNLAQRSADSAKQIKGLIKDSSQKVAEGSALVNTSGESLGEIVKAVSKVTDIVAEISAAAREQSTGIEQVNQAVTQMDEVTQQNAALVEQSAAASESLDEMAGSLTTLMQFFTLSQRDALNNSEGFDRGANGGVDNRRSQNSKGAVLRDRGANTSASGHRAAPARPTRAPVRAASSGGDGQWENF